MGLNNSLLKMNGTRHLGQEVPCFVLFIYMTIYLAGLAGGPPCQSFCVLLPGVSWRSLPYTCCPAHTSARPAYQARSRRRRGEWVRIIKSIIEPALLAVKTGVLKRECSAKL